MEKLAARFVSAFVSVRAEVVALCLQEIGRQTFGRVAVQERNRRSHARHRDAAFDRLSNHLAPRQKAVFQNILKYGSAPKNTKSGLFSYASRILLKNALRMMHLAPQQRSVAVVQIPAVAFARFADQHKALCVGNDFGCKQGLSQRLNPFLFAALRRA